MSITSADLPALLPGLLPRLWAFALRITGDKHDAEDLVQLACVRALERAHQFQPDSSLLSWMFSIVHSTWVNELRSRRVRGRSRSDWDQDLLETVSDPEAATPETSLMHHQILSAVNDLPEAQREVMLLVAIEQFSYKEAAAILNVPMGTVMSRLYRAREAIGALFKPAEKKYLLRPRHESDTSR
jgi:RNA polymerase sigma-70 factor (ECF subfamily)